MATGGTRTFLDLPRELRDVIYNDVYDPSNFRNKVEIVGRRGGNGRRGPNHLTAPTTDHRKWITYGMPGRARALFHTCTQIYAEALPVFLRLNKPRFPEMRDLYMFLAHIKVVDPASLECLRNLEIVRPTGTYVSFAVDLLMQCPLVHHLVLFRCTGCAFKRAPSKRINKWRSLRWSGSPNRPRPQPAWCDRVFFSPPPFNMVVRRCDGCLATKGRRDHPIIRQRLAVLDGWYAFLGRPMAANVTVWRLYYP